MGQGFGLSYGAGAGADTLFDAIRQKRQEQLDNFARQQQQIENERAAQLDAEGRRRWQLDYDERAATNKSLADYRAAEAERDRAAAASGEQKQKIIGQLIADPSLPEATRKWLTGATQGFNQLAVHDYEGAGEHQAHLDIDDQRKRTAAFEDWKQRENYRETQRRNRPVVGRLVMDDPTLPLGVQSHLTQLRGRHGDFNAALAEFQNSLEAHQRAHPRLSPVKAVNALRQMFTGAGRGTGASGSDPATAAAVREAMQSSDANPQGGIALRAPGLDGKAVSLAELQALAQRKGTTVEQEKQRATAAGFIVR